MTSEQSVYDTKEYKRSGFAYKLECAFEYFVDILISDAYLSNLLKAINMPDAVIGVVSSIISLAFCFQLITMLFVQRVSNTKRFTSVIHLVGRLFIVTLYFMPFFDFIPDAYKQVVAVCCIILGYFCNYIVTSMIYKWGNSFVHPQKRATFGATKEMLSLICGMVLTLVIGYVLDKKYASDEAQFIFLGVVVAVSTALDFICLMIMKRENENCVKVKAEPMISVIKTLFKNKSFVYVVILDCIHKAAVYMTVGYIGIFKTDSLAMSMGLVSVVGVVANLARFAISRPIGRLSDKTSYVTGITLGLAILSVSYLFIILITPGTWWLIIGYQVMYSISFAATTQNFFNVVYSYVDSEHFVQAMSIKNSISGVTGFLMSLVASVILGTIQGESGTGILNVFGTELYAQQVLAIISLALSICGFVFAQCVVKKQKVMQK